MESLSSAWASCIGLGAMAALMAVAPEALAEESESCRAARARASADASLLMAPQLLAQGGRFPELSQGGSLVDSPQNQARAALTFSFIDLYKGVRVLGVAEAECEAQRAQRDIESLLLSGEDLLRLPALRAQVEFLEAHQPDWRQHVAWEETRFEQRVVTLTELTAVRVKSSDLDRRLARAAAELAHISSLELSPPDAPVDVLSSRYLARADQLEEQLSGVRALAAWQLKLMGGTTMTSISRLGWFGTIELSLNLGALSERRQDALYLEAHHKYLKTNRTELLGRLRDLRTRVRGAHHQAANELTVVDGLLSVIAQARTSVESSELASAAHAATLLKLEEVSTQAEQVYLRALVDALSSFLEDPHE